MRRANVKRRGSSAVCKQSRGSHILAGSEDPAYVPHILAGSEDPAYVPLSSALVDIDHVILGVTDLAHGVRQFEAKTGVAPRLGGRHPGRDTQNALATLGDGRYLEILAPADPAAGSTDRRVRLNYRDLTFSGWALQTRSIEAAVARVRDAGVDISDPLPGSRRTPEGTLLEWKTAVLRGSGLELAPFLIRWSLGTVHPSTSSPEGCRLVALELEHPDPEPLQAFFAAADFAATLRQGTELRMTLTLDCPRGRVTFAGP